MDLVANTNANVAGSRYLSACTQEKNAYRPIPNAIHCSGDPTVFVNMKASAAHTAPITTFVCTARDPRSLARVIIVNGGITAASSRPSARNGAGCFYYG